MKKQLLHLFAALLPLLASAQNKIEIDGIWYNLVDKAQQAEVTFKGNSYSEYTGEYSDSINILTTVTYKDVIYSVTTIGDDAFRNCSSLTSITIPRSVTSIGNSTFYKCGSLTNINIPEEVTSIGYNAFYYCSSLTYINIPKSVESIKALAFKGCSSFTEITIPEGVSSIGESAFEKCSNLTTIRIPENSQLKSIEQWAFNACSSLTAIDIPESVTSIGSYAFKNCSSLTTINISENSQLTSIGSYAYDGCSSLTSIVLPKILKTVNSEAFANCPKLLKVFCYAEKVPSTKANAFDGSYPEYATLHVPASALNDYKNTIPWSNFGSIVALEDEEPLEKCATPTICYVDGEVVFTCKTEGAIIQSEVKENVSGKFEGTRITLTPTYTITAYATKAKFEDSDVATLTLYWIPCTEEHKSEETGIHTIPSKPVLISTQGGTITLSGLAADTEVAAYDTAGTQLATASATGGNATLTTHLTTGDIAIVKIGDYSIKVTIK